MRTQVAQDGAVGELPENAEVVTTTVGLTVVLGYN